MTCQNCGHENSPEARFCATCGARLASPEAPPDAPRFGPRPGDLRPRDLGDLITETYYVYARNFWPILFIAAIPQIPLLLAAVNPASPGAIIFTIIGILISLLAAGATIYAVAQQYIYGRVDVGVCYRQSLHVAMMLLIAFILVALTLLASAILAFIIVGIPMFFYFLVIWFFAPHVIIIEGRDPISALGRSRDLVRGSWWRVFGIGVTFALILIGISLITSLPAITLAFFASTVGNIISAIVNALLFPIVYIGGTLVYLDLRVRKEAYTVEMMASEVRRTS